MRNISSTALTTIREQVGTEPFIFVDVYWDGVHFVRYSDKLFPSAEGRILQFGNINEAIRLQGSGTSGSVDIIVDDTDGFLQDILNKRDIHFAPVIVYQGYQGLDLTHSFEVFRGHVASPIVWSEGERQLSFTILSSYTSWEVGFSPEAGQFPGISNELAGKNWPLCFGSPIHVPAAKSSEVKTGTLMTMFCIPDFTLKYKRAMLVQRSESLLNSYNTMQMLLVKCKEISRPAYMIQEDYANKIVAYDNLRQTIEDLVDNITKLNKQLEQLIDEYHACDNTVPLSQLKVRIKNLTQNRDNQNDRLRDTYNQKRNLEKFFDNIVNEADNCKYKLTVINKIRKKSEEVVRAYFDTLDNIKMVDLHIFKQQQNYLQQIGVAYGVDFPQGQQVTVSFDGHLVQGYFDNNVFNVSYVKPKYGQLNLTNRLDNDINAIWLEDNQVKLTGMFLKLNNGNIVKVTKQEGNKVHIELPKKINNPRVKEKNIDYSGNVLDKQAFQQGLTRLLTGIEPDATIAKIANRLPKDISPKIWSILGAEQNNQYVELKKNADDVFDIDMNNSTFTLIYGDDELTAEISFNDSPDTIKTKILDSTLSIGVNDIDIQIVENLSTALWTKILIKINNLMKPLRIHDRFFLMDNEFGRMNQLVTFVEDKTPTIAIIKLNLEALKPDTTLSTNGYFDIIYRGQRMTFTHDATGNDIQVALEAADILIPGEVTITGGPLSSQDIQIEYDVPFEAFLVDETGLEIDYDDDDLLNPLDPSNIPGLRVEVSGGNAFEYTKKQREKKIKEQVENNIHAPAIKKTKDAVSELRKIVEDEETDAQQQKEFELILAERLDDLRALSQKITQDEFDTSEAYKIISEQEQKLLYELEITGYLEWINNYRPLDLELKESDYQFTAFDVTGIVGASKIIPKQWVEHFETLNIYEQADAALLLPDDTSAYYGYAGDRVVLEADYQEKYIANLLPSTIHSVYAKKNVDGFVRLVPVPSSYYVKNQSDNYGIFTASTITFVQPLKTIDSSWHEDIYVTLTSSVGPNICDIIEWIVENFTNYTVDPVSFLEVWGHQINYPANFALLSKKDALTLIQEIAWQSRCNVKVKGNKVYITYLCAEPSSVATITEDDVEEKSLFLSFTETEQIVTMLEASWRNNYASEKPWTIRLRRNLNKYKLHTEQRDFYIYNIKSLVMKSATFWLLRYSNTYKKVTFKTFLNHLDLEVDDCITLDFNNNYFSDGAIKGLVEKAEYDSNTRSILMEVWLPILSGTKVKYDFSWPKDLSVAESYPDQLDVASGDAGSPVGIKVPTNLGWDDVNNLDIRPNDFGTQKMSDIDDDYPENPANEFDEKDFEFGPESPLTIAKENPKDLTQSELKWMLDSGYQPRTVGEENDKHIIYIGRIVSSENVNTIHPDNIEGADDSEDIEEISFAIRLTNGKIIIAYPLYSVDNQTVNNMAVYVVYNKDSERFEFIPPTAPPSTKVPEP